MTGEWYGYVARWILDWGERRRMDLNGSPNAPTVHLIGVSVPRSGHNLVVRLLQALLAEDLFYCERYLVADCCQAMPCARRGTRRITFQKSHDLELDLPRDVGDACYVIQHRAPVPAILSAREKYAEEFGEAIAADRGAYAVWLGQNAHYLVTFYERWIANPPAWSVVVDYDDLVADPAEALRRIAGAAGIDVPEERLQAAVARTMPRGGQFGERPFVPRSIDASRYFDRDLLADFESIVIDAVPEYAARRVFDPVEYRETLIWRVYAALRAQWAGDVEEGIRLLGEATERWPDNGMLLYEQAWPFLRQERYAEAQRLLERSAERLPTHGPVLSLLVTAALAAGDVASALEPMRALATEVEPTLASRLRLAKVLAHHGDRPGTAAILDEVLSAAPQDPEVWREVSTVRQIRGELSEARLALESAIQLAPLQADLYFRHGQVLLTLGKPRRAGGSLRHSLALNPRQPAAWRLLAEALQDDGDHAGIVEAVDEARACCPDDVELLAAMAEARSRALIALPLAHQRRPTTAGGVARRLRRIAARLPGSRRVERVGDRIVRRLASRVGPVSRQEIQFAQLRAALGASEGRLVDTEQWMHGELEAAWAQAQRLEGALRALEATVAEEARQREEAWEHAEAAWEQAEALARALEAQTEATRGATEAAESVHAHAERLDAVLAEQTQVARDAWARAEHLGAVLAEQTEIATAAWAQANKLDAALAVQARGLQAMEAEIERLNLAVSERDRGLHGAWEEAHRLDAALQDKERELALLRAIVRRQEQALDEANAERRRVVAGSR